MVMIWEHCTKLGLKENDVKNSRFRCLLPNFHIIHEKKNRHCQSHKNFITGFRLISFIPFYVLQKIENKKHMTNYSERQTTSRIVVNRNGKFGVFNLNFKNCLVDSLSDEQKNAF